MVAPSIDSMRCENILFEGSHCARQISDSVRFYRFCAIGEDGLLIDRVLPEAIAVYLTLDALGSRLNSFVSNGSSPCN
jgi:hypothetical protein